ncbi:transcription factor [Castilleja foliolosa]|uniref:Transcription factor n=1 Tax=Castilleja foliolosa TaxID=1961234 RepID=A0ABD3CE20_9LAMI
MKPSFVSMPLLIRILVGSLSSAAHFSATSSSALEDLEKASLPVFLRMLGLLTLNVFAPSMFTSRTRGEKEGQLREVDIKNLGSVERKNLVDRLLKTHEEEGSEKFLMKLKERIHRRRHADRRRRSIAMTLLLGPPSSGKTTLLMALAGKLDPQLNVSGRVTYNGHDMTEFVPQRTSAYISQHDLHIGELTVRETLAFSARYFAELLAELSRREKQANIAMPDPDLDVVMKAASIGGQEASVMTDYIIKILGLEICADTLVGDEMFRGISGGQRKRLTAGEMMVGPARALFMDEISTGLDSSTTFEIVNSIRESIHILQGTTIISLLQPAPETYDLFDDIILLSDGQIVYQGPRECVLEFFEFMGFRCPEKKRRRRLFARSVTSKKDQEQYWMKSDEPYNYISAKEFSEAFQSFHVGRKLCDELSVPFPKETSHPAALMTNKYGLNKKEILKACVAREFLLMKRNSFVYIFKMIKVIIMAIISMTVFLRTEMHKKTVIDGGIYMGALFYALMAAMFNGFSELALSILKLPVLFKQKDLLFFPSWAYSIPAWILKIPITLLEASFWVGITYYTTGYDSDAESGFYSYA